MSEAKIAAVIWVLLKNVVALVAPLKFTVAPLTKPAPLTVNANAAEPATALEGESELIVGTALLIVKEVAFEVPPGPGFVTVTVAVPAVAISAAVIVAVSCVALMNVVVLAPPLNFTTEVDTKPVPFTVRVKATPPAFALVGESEVTVGAGLLMVKDCAFDVPPAAGFVAVTLTVPAVAISAAGIVATICVPVTEEGVIAGLVPKFTVAPVTKPVPVRVNVKAAPPELAKFGARELRVGVEAGLIVNDTEADVPPPGAGFVTVTVAVPAVAISAAVIAAVRCVALTNVVVLAAPLNFTTDVETKPVPFTVREKAEPPAVALVGESEVTVGAGLLMVKD